MSETAATSKNELKERKKNDLCMKILSLSAFLHDPIVLLRFLTFGYLDLRGVFSPPLIISDQTSSDLSVTGNDRSIEYYFASDAR